MRRNAALQPGISITGDGSRQANGVRKGRGKFLLGLYGMLAEILFVLGLALIGFLFSLFGGW